MKLISIVLKANKAFLLIVLFFSLILTITSFVNTSREEKLSILDSPYNIDYKYTYKVNLHAHSTRRNKKYAYSPVELLSTARNFGFDAYAITDLPNAGGIVEDPLVKNIIHIQGIEYGGTPHIVGIGINNLIQSDAKQQQINHILEQGGYVYLPHPDFGKYNLELFLKLHNLNGIAVFNSLTYRVAELDSNNYNTIEYNERLIDSILSNGNKIGIIAEEDTKYEEPHRYSHQLNTAWINVYGDVPKNKLSTEYIIKQIKENRFTSHARESRNSPPPPKFTSIKTKDNRIFVKVDKKCIIEFITFQGKKNKIISNRKKATYNIQQEDQYVRIKVIYSDHLNNESWAWSNPIYFITK